MRLLLAHPRFWNDPKIDAFVAHLKSHYPGHEVVSGRDSYALHAPALGSFEDWARWCGAGMGADGRPSYNMILVPEPVCGMGVYRIVEAALAIGRKVFALNAALDHGTAWAEVLACRVNFGDWKRGGELLLDEDRGLGCCGKLGCGRWASRPVHAEVDGPRCPLHEKEPVLVDARHGGSDEGVPF